MQETAEIRCSLVVILSKRSLSSGSGRAARCGACFYGKRLRRRKRALGSLPYQSAPTTHKFGHLPHNFLSHPRHSGVKSRQIVLPSPRREAGVTHNVLAPRSFRREVFGMEDRAPVVPSTEQSSTTTTAMMRKREGRGAWVLTAYGICGLALFGVLAYFFSDFIAH
jgi:hypothetical protein